MEIITEYYIWFIIGGIILFMTLIGYIADKSNYIEKQKNKNKEKKNSIIEQKQKHITKKSEQFIKSIGDGKNLVLEENEINYPVDVKEVKIETQELIENKDLKEVGIGSLLEKEEKPQIENSNIEKNDIEKPLENGVLNLDEYDKEDNDELWKF